MGGRSGPESSYVVRSAVLGTPALWQPCSFLYAHHGPTPASGGVPALPPAPEVPALPPPPLPAVPALESSPAEPAEPPSPPPPSGLRPGGSLNVSQAPTRSAT